MWKSSYQPFLPLYWGCHYNEGHYIEVSLYYLHERATNKRQATPEKDRDGSGDRSRLIERPVNCDDGQSLSELWCFGTNKLHYNRHCHRHKRFGNSHCRAYPNQNRTTDFHLSLTCSSEMWSSTCNWSTWSDRFSFFQQLQPMCCSVIRCRQILSILMAPTTMRQSKQIWTCIIKSWAVEDCSLVMVGLTLGYNAVRKAVREFSAEHNLPLLDNNLPANTWLLWKP